jgi:hypothetical protein
MAKQRKYGIKKAPGNWNTELGEKRCCSAILLLGPFESLFSREQTKSECDWAVMSSVFECANQNMPYHCSSFYKGHLSFHAVPHRSFMDVMSKISSLVPRLFVLTLVQRGTSVRTKSLGTRLQNIHGKCNFFACRGTKEKNVSSHPIQGGGRLYTDAAQASKIWYIWIRYKLFATHRTFCMILAFLDRKQGKSSRQETKYNLIISEFQVIQELVCSSSF